MDALFHVGMDVHSTSVDAVVPAGDQVQPESKQSLPYDFAKLRRPFQRLLRRGPVIAAYEAGCIGFELARFLEDLNVLCVVAAPGKPPQKPADRIKTNRRDALKLAWLLRSGELDAVRIPSRDDEAVRDYLRARGDLRTDLMATKHRLQKFLLRHLLHDPWDRFDTGFRLRGENTSSFRKLISHNHIVDYIHHQNE